MFLKELYKATGMELKVHNIVTDYTLKDGTRAHMAVQVFDRGVNATDENIIDEVKKILPAGSRVCTMIEFLEAMELTELDALTTSPISMTKPRRCIYLDKELAAEYIAEVAKEMGMRK